MVAKISSSENLGAVLGYNFKKVLKEEASVILVNKLYLQDEGAYTMDEVLADMEQTIPKQYRTKKTVFHCSLNPHPDEELSDEQLQAIAQDYMTELGYGEQPFIVFKHNDIEREHIHIVSLRVNSEGKKISDSFEKWRSKRITNKLEEKYHLIPSSQPSIKPKTKVSKVDTTQGNIKEQVAQVLKEVWTNYAFQSMGEMNAVLADYRLKAEEVKSEYHGKQYEGIVYVPIDDEGEKITTPINAKDLERGYGYTALQTKMKQSKALIKPHIPDLRSKVVVAMQTSPQTIQELKKELTAQGLDCLIRSNAQGRIYCITFIDHKQGLIVNGSRLGKGYSANIFNSYFNNTANNPFLDESLYPKTTIKTKQKQEISTQLNNQQEEGDSFHEDIIGDLLDMASSSANDDWKEKAWQKKLRRQNKMKISRRR